MFAAVHEKIFVLFMITSLLYELLTLIVFKWAHPHLNQQPRVSNDFMLDYFSVISYVKWFYSMDYELDHGNSLISDLAECNIGS